MKSTDEETGVGGSLISLSTYNYEMIELEFKARAALHHYSILLARQETTFPTTENHMGRSSQSSLTRSWPTD